MIFIFFKLVNLYYKFPIVPSVITFYKIQTNNGLYEISNEMKQWTKLKF